MREALDVTFAQDHLSSTRRTRNEGTTTLRVALTVRKRPATRLTYEQDGGPLEFHIAAEGSPFLLRVTHPATDLDERYGDFGEPFRVTAPPRAVSELRIAQEVLAAG